MKRHIGCKVDIQCERKGDVRKWWSVESIGKDVGKKAETTGYKALEKKNWRSPENKLYRDKFWDYTITDFIMLLKLWH